MDHSAASLDPTDWTTMRALGHRMMADAMDHLQQVRSRPVWQPMPEQIRAGFREALPLSPQDARAVYADYLDTIQPYAVGNIHPGFMGWVHGGGTAIGMLAELLAGSLNANLGGRDQAPIEVERQVIRWSAELLGLPSNASGVLVTGTSVANFMAVVIARTAVLGTSVRQRGLRGKALTGYTSEAAHGCIARGLDMAGLGSDALRLVPADRHGRMDIARLKQRFDDDVAHGAMPFIVIGTAGSVNTGAIDDLDALGAFCRARNLWFHIDAAYGAMAACSPRHRQRIKGIETADSVAFDFHKWGQVQYDAGCLIVRNPARHLDAFSNGADYLQREQRGLAAGDVWPCDLGPDLSRGFRALKIWMTLKTYGIAGLGAVVEQCCAVAQYLAEEIRADEAFELLAPVTLNIVCFRYRLTGENLDHLNAAIVVALQEAGLVAPSKTIIDGKVAIRAAIVNHRTGIDNVEMLLPHIKQIVSARDNRARVSAETKTAPKSSESIPAHRPSWPRRTQPSGETHAGLWE